MNDKTYKERCDEILLSRGKFIRELVDLGSDVKGHRVDGSDKKEIKKNISRIITDARTCIDTRGKTTEEVVGILNGLTRTNSNKDKLDEWFKESLSNSDNRENVPTVLVGKEYTNE